MIEVKATDRGIVIPPIGRNDFPRRRESHFAFRTPQKASRTVQKNGIPACALLYVHIFATF
ncbi:MAG: hypothetical protein V4724_41190, partial [Pseudomonadota bacterium]